MSLINDALKRATKAQAQVPPPAADSGESKMQPAEGRPSPGLPSYFFPALMIVFCGAFWFLLRGWEAQRQFGLYPDPINIQAREVPQEEPGPEALTSEGATQATETNSVVETTRNRDSAPIETPPSAENAPEAVYRLQGIFYRPSRPSAVVNSKTVYVGDLIAGGTVKAIDRQGVTIEREGRSIVLTLQ